MLEGTKRLFPTDYERFKDAMIEAANNEELPISLQMDEIQNFTLKDFQDTFYEFERDTGLSIIGSLFICPECGRLHVLIEVDYSDTDNIPLQ